jgi:hypothetical protein
VIKGRRNSNLRRTGISFQLVRTNQTMHHQHDGCWSSSKYLEIGQRGIPFLRLDCYTLFIHYRKSHITLKHPEIRHDQDVVRPSVLAASCTEIEPLLPYLYSIVRVKLFYDLSDRSQTLPLRLSDNTFMRNANRSVFTWLQTIRLAQAEMIVATGLSRLRIRT